MMLFSRFSVVTSHMTRVSGLTMGVTSATSSPAHRPAPLVANPANNKQVGGCIPHDPSCDPSLNAIISRVFVSISMDQIPSPHVLYSYIVPSKSDVWDTQTFVSTNPFYPCSIIPHPLEIILLYFSFKRVFGTSLTEQTGAIDQDPQNSAGKYFMWTKIIPKVCAILCFKVI